MPVIPALRRLRKEDHEFQASLLYLVRSCLKNKRKENKQKIVSIKSFNFSSSISSVYEHREMPTMKFDQLKKLYLFTIG
jgi:hypothetical protein